MRLMPSAPPNSPASNTTLSRGDAWPDRDASVVVQSSWANTNAAKSTSSEKTTSRSRVDPSRVECGRPGLDVGDVLESARDRLEQFRLLARRPEEDARLVHAQFMMKDIVAGRSSGRHRQGQADLVFDAWRMVVPKNLASLPTIDSGS